ncbi:hypothetical protein ABPG75_000747 [Micractinium tetrahymenae]
MAGLNEGPSPQRLPILALHLWEHAYLQKDSAEDGRAAYIEAFFSAINWQGVSELFELAAAGEYDRFDALVPARN